MNKKNFKVLYLLPSFIGIFIFYIIPFYEIVRYAFTENTVNNRFAGLDNFQKILNNPYFKLAVHNTLLFTVITVSVTMLLSIAIALLLWMALSKLTFFQKLFLLPAILPSALIAFVCRSYFDFLDPFLTLVLVFIWKYCGLNIALIFSSLLQLKQEMFDAARVDGADTMHMALRIALPNVIPGIVIALILTIINTFKIYRESYLLWSSHPDERVYMLQNFMDNNFQKMDFQSISAAAILFLLCIYLVVALVYFFERKWSNQIL